jgi:predicted Zn-dependent protease
MMIAPKQVRRIREKLLACVEVILCSVFVSCSIPPTIPTLQDDRIDELVRSEAARIITASEDWENFPKYQFFLTEFPRKDILGLSVGNGQIYISHSLASLAFDDWSHRWLLRQTVAHEIAHETAGHAKHEGGMWFNRPPLAWGASGREIGLPWYVRFYNYSTEKELEADRIALGYWKKLGWDCRIWVDLLVNFEHQGYRGDSSHPTSDRLRQARNLCDTIPKPISLKAHRSNS